MSGEREAGGQGWPTPCPDTARACPASGMGVATSCGSLVHLWYFLAPNIPEKIKIRFLEFFEKLYFRDISQNWQMLKIQKNQKLKR